jgi:hypothetical protein
MSWHRCFGVSFVVLMVHSWAAARAGDAPFADEKQLKAAGIGVDGQALLKFFKQRTLSDGESHKLQELVRQLGDDAFETREQASSALVERGRAAVPFLKAARDHKDPEVSGRAKWCLERIGQRESSTLVIAAVHTLAKQAPDGTVAALVDFVPFAEDDEIWDAITTALGVVGMHDGKADPALSKALKDSLPRRRAIAAYLLGQAGNKDLQAEAARLLDDADLKVRLRAAQGLLAGQNKRAVAAFIDLLTAPGSDIGWQAEDNLLHIAGERAPRLPSGSDREARRKQQDVWKAWWRDEGEKVDLAKVSRDPPLLGYTVLSQAAKVWECDRDGKARWTLTGFVNPIQARMLPGSRVLITENTGKRVVECNMDGKVLWEKKTGDNAIAAERLANGNTFIATNSALTEVDRDGKEVYQYLIASLRPGGARFEGACRLRSGHILATIGSEMIEVDSADGKVVKTTRLPCGSCYNLQGLAGGRCLLASHGSGKVLEIDENGKVVWEYALLGAFHATRLPNGNTLMTSHSGNKVLEVTAAKELIWERKLDANVWAAIRR